MGKTNVEQAVEDLVGAPAGVGKAAAGKGKPAHANKVVKPTNGKGKGGALTKASAEKYMAEGKAAKAPAKTAKAAAKAAPAEPKEVEVTKDQRKAVTKAVAALDAPTRVANISRDLDIPKRVAKAIVAELVEAGTAKAGEDKAGFMTVAPK